MTHENWMIAAVVMMFFVALWLIGGADVE